MEKEISRHAFQVKSVRTPPHRAGAVTVCLLCVVGKNLVGFRVADSVDSVLFGLYYFFSVFVSFLSCHTISRRMKEFVLQDELPISVEEFWSLFFRDPEFTIIFHEVRGDTDTQVGSWTAAPEGRKQRVVRFVSPTASNSFLRTIAGVTTQIKEFQLCHFTADGHFCFSSKSLFEKPARVEINSNMKWEVTPNARGCFCAITVCSEYKGKLFTDSIENYLQDELEDSLGQWFKLAHSKLEDYVPISNIDNDVIVHDDDNEGLTEKKGKQRAAAPTITSIDGRGDESEGEGLTPTKKTYPASDDFSATEKEKEVDPVSAVAAAAPHGYLRESATERAKRIIARKVVSDSSSSDEDEDEDETDNTESENSDEDEEAGGEFYESTDELSALARLDGAQSTEEKFALLQAYSRAMQVELGQLKELVLSVQTRMMRLETAPATTPLPPSRHYDYHTPQVHKNGVVSTPLSESINGTNSDEKEMRYRDLAIQRALANTQRRLDELEAALQRTAQCSPASRAGGGDLGQRTAKRRGLLPFLTSNSWLVNVPFIVFVICWPLVSHKVLGWGSTWGLQLVSQIQKLFWRRSG